TMLCPSGQQPSGGGIYSAAGMSTTSVTLTNVIVTGNTATHGGGIDNELGSTLVMTGVTVSGNMASVAGGGVVNEARAPGATLTNVTISGNTAGTGGGLTNDGDLTLSFVTISGNSLDGSGDHTIRNTILAKARPAPTARAAGPSSPRTTISTAGAPAA